MSWVKKIFILTVVFVLGIIIGIAINKISDSGQVETVFHSPLSLSRKNIIGFMPYWLLDKAKESYKPYLTTLAYYALTINPDGTIQEKVNDIEEEPGWTTFKKDELQKILAQAKKDGLKTSLLIFTVNEEDIASLVSDPPQSATNLLNNVVPIMEEHKFSDLNMDIESFTKASPSSQLKYAQFLREVKNGLSENNLGTLTVDITPESLIKPRLTKASYISDIADYIVLMGYDYHYIYSAVSGPVGPIGGGRSIYEYDVEIALNLALQTIPPEKLILGIPLYGYEWETIESTPGSAIIPFSGKTASARRIEEILKDCDNCIKGIDETGQQPYIIIPENNYYRQIYYEDENSLSKKLELAQKYNLAGVAFWALGYESTNILEPLKSFK